MPIYIYRHLLYILESIYTDTYLICSPSCFSFFLFFLHSCSPFFFSFLFLLSFSPSFPPSFFLFFPFYPFSTYFEERTLGQITSNKHVTQSH